MERNTIESIVAELLTVLLGIPVSTATDVRMSECSQWDSLKHIEIIMTVEQRFGVSFPSEKIPLLVTQVSLVDGICELRGYE